MTNGKARRDDHDRPVGADGGLDLTDVQRRELVEAMAEADRGEGVDGWQLLEELERA